MRHLLIVVTMILVAALILFSSSSMLGAARGFELFISSVFPALFPFFVCISILKRLGMFEIRGKNTAGAIIRIFLVSCIAGCPTGSLLTEICFGGKSPSLSLKKRSMMSAICNLSSPVFIIGTVCTNMLQRPKLAYLIALAHYGSAAIMIASFILINKKSFSFCTSSHPLGSQGISSILPGAITDSVTTMLKLGGTLVFFSVIISILQDIPIINKLFPAEHAVLFGILEMTNGIGLIASSGVNIKTTCCIICSLLSFGGICIFVQASSVAGTDAVSYLSVKLVHAILAWLICFLLFPLFRADSLPVSSGMDETLVVSRALAIGELALCGLFASCFAILFSVLISGRTKAA